VAQIGRTGISQATLDHWTTVQSITNYETSPRGPVPNWVVAKPPGYAACIAHLQATTANNATRQSTRSVSELKSECQQEHEAIRRHALAVLIHYVWVFGEAVKLGINPTGSEVQRISARFKREVFGSEAAFRKFLKLTGLSLSEELMRIKANILAERIERKLSGQDHAGKQGIAKFAEEYTESWTAKTNCRPGYVIPGCKQYNGPR